MSVSLPERRYFARQPPRSVEQNGALAPVPGSIVSLPVTVSPGVIQLNTTYVGKPAQGTVAGVGQNSAFNDQVQGLCGVSSGMRVRLCLQAVTATVGVITGPVVGDVTGANAPVLATQGTINGVGIYGPVVGTCWQIAPGAILEFEADMTQDAFLGFVGSGTGSLLVFQCSQPNA